MPALLFLFPHSPISWSADQPFSEQDPVVNDNYWNTVLAKTSRDHPAQSLAGSGTPKPSLTNSDSRWLQGVLILPGGCEWSVHTLTAQLRQQGPGCTHVWKMLFPPSLRTLGTMYEPSQPKGLPYLQQLICSKSSKGKGSQPQLPREVSQHVQGPQIERNSTNSDDPCSPRAGRKWRWNPQ